MWIALNDGFPYHLFPTRGGDMNKEQRLSNIAEGLLERQKLRMFHMRIAWPVSTFSFVLSETIPTPNGQNIPKLQWPLDYLCTTFRREERTERKIFSIHTLHSVYYLRSRQYTMDVRWNIMLYLLRVRVRVIICLLIMWVPFRVGWEYLLCACFSAGSRTRVILYLLVMWVSFWVGREYVSCDRSD